MKYSKTSQAAGGSGFHLDHDTKAPKDSFLVSAADFKAATNLPAGSMYSFSAPMAPSKVGVLSVTPPSGSYLLTQAKDAQIAKNSQACATAITAGQKSNATGKEYTYPTSLTDQLNLSAAVNASLSVGLAPGWTMSLKCADGTGKWAFVSHTAAQIQQVNSDVNNAISALRVRNDALSPLIKSATTLAVVYTATF
jgi:hypothetical protein